MTVSSFHLYAFLQRSHCLFYHPLLFPHFSGFISQVAAFSWKNRIMKLPEKVESHCLPAFCHVALFQNDKHFKFLLCPLVEFQQTSLQICTFTWINRLWDLEGWVTVSESADLLVLHLWARQREGALVIGRRRETAEWHLVPVFNMRSCRAERLQLHQWAFN